MKYKPSVSRQGAVDLLLNGYLDLVAAEHNAGSTADDFRQGITTWSMPYRGREGRSTRFVLYGSEISDERHPIGLLEVGDDAPHSPIRDSALGLGPQSFTVDERLRLANRMQLFRRALRYEDLPYKSTDELDVLLNSLEQMKMEGKGRTGALESMEQRKRHTYLARFVGAGVR